MRKLLAALLAVIPVLASAQPIQPQTWSQFLAGAPPVTPNDSYLMPFVLPGGSGVITGRATVGQLGTYIIGTYGTGLQPKALSNGFLWVGNQSNIAAAVPMSGDCSLIYTGSITCLKTNGVPFGTAAIQNIGTSGGTVGLLNANKTDSGNNTFSGTNNFTGSIQIGGTGVTLPVPVSIGGTGQTTAWQARGALCPGRTIPSGSSDTATTADCQVRWNKSVGSASSQTLPACNSANDKFSIIVTDEKGDAATNPITVTPVSGTILNFTGFIINSPGGSISLRCDGANTNYTII